MNELNFENNEERLKFLEDKTKEKFFTDLNDTLYTQYFIAVSNTIEVRYKRMFLNFIKEAYKRNLVPIPATAFVLSKSFELFDNLIEQDAGVPTGRINIINGEILEERHDGNGGFYEIKTGEKI